MSTKIDEQGVRLAERIRAEREARGWSLDTLAERSGVSRAMISKIERCEASPTATVLVRLAGAFELTLAGLIARAAATAGRLVWLADQPTWRDPETGYLRRQIFERPDHPLEVVRIEMPAGARVSAGAVVYQRTRHLVWVIEGALVLEDGGERHELATGDCLSFSLPAAITYANETDRLCVYLVIVVRTELPQTPDPDA
jgi:transcriptional regulator with XRE-family HTH domain